jgi:hypothetical protein
MGRFQLAASGSNTYLLDTENGNVYTPVEGKDGPLVWKLHVKGNVMRQDRVTRPLRTLTIEEAP